MFNAGHDADTQEPCYIMERHALTCNLHLKSSWTCMFMQMIELLKFSGQSSEKNPHHRWSRRLEDFILIDTSKTDF